LTKQKSFQDKPKLKSTSNKLTGWLNTSENPIHIEDDERPPEILQEHADDVPELRDIPESDASNKRQDTTADEDEPLFVSSEDEEFFATQCAARPSKRRRRDRSVQDATRAAEAEDEEAAEAPEDNKKKLAMNTSYDGFSIYGRILCLVVKRKGKRSQPLQTTAPAGGSQMMEQWVSTQAAQDAGLDEDDDG
ncbi:hypothetical protein KC352_g39194, partial [Hortaea werneckii]